MTFDEYIGWIEWRFITGLILFVIGGTFAFIWFGLTAIQDKRRQKRAMDEVMDNDCDHDCPMDCSFCIDKDEL